MTLAATSLASGLTLVVVLTLGLASIWLLVRSWRTTLRRRDDDHPR